MKVLFTIFGLILEIIGVAIIIRSEVSSSAAILKQAKEVIFNPNKGKLLTMIAFWFARIFGSSKALDTQSYIGDSFVAKFWGFILLLFGFILQSIGVLVK